VEQKMSTFLEIFIRNQSESTGIFFPFVFIGEKGTLPCHFKLWEVDVRLFKDEAKANHLWQKN